MSDHPGPRASVGQHIPLLRRYARALTGSRHSGDVFVRTTLEAMLEDPDRLRTGHPSRVELFRLFHLIWEPVAEPGAFTPDPTPDDGSRLALGEGLLQQLPRTRRDAFLLTALEGFSIGEAAIILDRPLAEVERDIASARAAMTSDTASRIIIVEDEAVIAMHLQDIVEAMGHEVAGIASTHREAVALAARGNADLVLADVCLADGSSGIDAVAEIIKSSAVPVIFITAFPERLLTGEATEPTYLIAKPFEDETVMAAVGQALLSHREGQAMPEGSRPAASPSAIAG